MIKDLIKKYRIDAVYVRELGVEAGIYVNPTSGEFYARVPEVDSGTRYASRSKPDLEAQVRKALHEFYGLTWSRVILVNYPRAKRYSGSGVRGSMGVGTRWSPEDPTSASDVVGPLLATRHEVAIRADGRHVIRDWLIEDGRPDIRRVSLFEPGTDGVVLPYSEATWDAVNGFALRIRDLDHRIRLLLQSDDLESKLLTMAGTRLLESDGDR